MVLLEPPVTDMLDSTVASCHLFSCGCGDGIPAILSVSHGFMFVWCRQRNDSTLLDMDPLGDGDLRQALQKVNAELEEANKELHDLREV